MKKRFRLHCLLFLCAVFFIISCDKDQTTVSSTTEFRSVTSSVVSLEALSGNINLLEKLSHFNLRVKGKSQKKVYSNIYDFCVDPDKVLVLKKDNYISYTFPFIKREKKKRILYRTYFYILIMEVF